MKRKLLLLAAFVAGALGMRAQTDDVTDKYLQNADFGNGPEIKGNVFGYDYDAADQAKNPDGTGVAQFQTVANWSSIVLNSNGGPNNGMGAGVFKYGSKYQLKGNNTPIPDNGPDGTNGYGFAFFAVWGAGGYYYQEVNLDAGKYTLTFPINFMQKGTQTPTMYTGFLADGGTLHTVNFADVTEGWKNYTVEFVLTEATQGKLIIGFLSSGQGSGANPHMIIDRVQIECQPFATEADYQALDNAINKVKENTLGFDKGEFAPYNHVEALRLLAKANAINREEQNGQADVQNLTTALNEVVWTPNEEEVNAIWDASFEYEYSTTGYVQPIAWTGVGRAGSSHNNATDVRWMWDNTTNKGLNATSSKHALFTKFGATYGEQVGYTLPLKKETYYTLKFIYGGWGDCQGDGYVTMQDPDAASLSLDPSERLPLDNKTEANSKEDAWKNYRAFFKTNAEGNYVLGLRKDREASDQQSQYVYGDFAFFKTTVEEATEYYNGILEEVKKAYIEEAYNGSEKAAFKAAIDASMDGKSVSEIFEAAANLLVLKDAFVNAQAAYDAYQMAMNFEYDEELPYALTTKKEAITTKKAESVTTAEAATKAAHDIMQLIRQYVESNGLAEGIDGAENVTNLLGDIQAEQNKGWTGGIDIKEDPKEKYTDGNDEPSLKYYDGGWKADAGVNINMSRTLAIPAGKYLLTVTARGSEVLTEYTMTVGDIVCDLPHNGSGVNVGVFGHGWDDVSVEFVSDGLPCTLQFTAKSSEFYQWISFNRFRLVKIGDIDTDVTVTEAGYATYVTPTAVEFGDDVEAFVVRSADGEKAQMEAITTAPAHTPVIIKATAETYTLTPIETAEEVGDNWLKISDGTITRATGIYVLANIDDVVGFYALKEDVTLPEGKVYLEVPGTDDVKFIGFDFGETTGINAVEHINTENAVIYNLAGQRVQTPTRGIYIMNGKKVLVK